MFLFIIVASLCLRLARNEKWGVLIFLGDQEATRSLPLLSLRKRSCESFTQIQAPILMALFGCESFLIQVRKYHHATRRCGDWRDETYLKKEKTRRYPNNKENRHGHVGQCIGILLEKFAVTKLFLMSFSRVSQRSAKCRAEYAPNCPHQRHYAESAGLEFFLWNQLCDNGPDNAHIPISQSNTGSCQDGHG